MAPIHHIGLYTFKTTLSASEIQESTANMLLLKSKCLNPTTGKPYIVSMSAGPNLVKDSPYGGGYTHSLLMTFACKEDWDYYVKEDPAHIQFIKENQDWEKACVIDLLGEE